jgi:hypothetical protein
LNLEHQVTQTKARVSQKGGGGGDADRGGGRIDGWDNSITAALPTFPFRESKASYMGRTRRSISYSWFMLLKKLPSLNEVLCVEAQGMGR